MEHIDKIIKLQSLAIMVISVAISIIDIKTYRIPDTLLVILLLSLIFFDFLKAYNEGCNQRYSFISTHLLSAIIIFTIFFAIYYFVKSMGFGDVKYASVLAYGLGLKGIYIALAIATIGSLILFFVGYFLLGWSKKTKLPFALFLSIGAIFSIIGELYL